MINCLVILNPTIMQMLYFNGDDITKSVILKRSEESRKIFFNHFSLDSSQRFRMTEKSKDVIGKQSEESHKPLIPKR